MRQRAHLGWTVTRSVHNPLLDPAHDLVGGAPEQLGPWQLQLLLDHGLTRRDHVLDLGCGTLRGGLHLIDFLEAGRYIGVDPNAALLAHGERLVDAAGLRAKSPKLAGLDSMVQSPPGPMDLVLTQSVLNHLDANQIVRTVQRVGAWMAPGGLWIGTCAFDAGIVAVDEGEPHPVRADERWHSVMSPTWFGRALREQGMLLEIDTGHTHPRGLDVFVVRRVRVGLTGVR